MSTESEDSRNNSSDEEDNRYGNHNQRYRDHFRYNHKHAPSHHTNSQNDPQDENYRWSSLSNTRVRDNEDNPEPDIQENIDDPGRHRSNKETNKSLIEQQAIKSNRVETLIKAMLPPSAAKTFQNSKASSSSLRLLSRNGTASKKSESNSNFSSTNDENTNRLAESFISEIRAHHAKQSAAAAAAALTVSPFSSSITSQIGTLRNIREANDKDGNNKTDDTAALNVAVLKLLIQLEIKYPGKTSDETRILLQKVFYNLF